MNFHDFMPMFAIFKKHAGITETAEEFYTGSWDAARRGGDATSANQFEAERRWLRDKKPYYNVWPSIIPMLTRLKLDIDAGLIHPPMDALLIRLPTDKNPLFWDDDGDRHFVKTILLTSANVQGSAGLTAWMDIGESQQLGPNLVAPIYTFRNIRTEPGRTIESDLDALADAPSLNVGLRIPRSLELDCLRLVSTLCLIANDPEIITADVLSKDRAKYEETLDPKYIVKAIRRGKRGWNVGASIEVIPHVRRPHPALVWTGKGRTIPKIVMRKGSIVHREVIERMPTGNETES